VLSYLVPQPRTNGAEIFGRYATAAMDISDGLAGDLLKLCRASRVGADVDAARVPLSQAAGAALARDSTLLEPVLTGGDDYEILATVPAGKLEAMRSEAAAKGVAVTEIGTIRAREGPVRVLDQHGKALAFARASFSHF
jgi:thiamine-monophosphate kinase